MSKVYRALLRERPELAAISDAEISAAAAAIDMVDRMTAGLSYFELLEAYARAALAAAQMRVELDKCRNDSLAAKTRAARERLCSSGLIHSGDSQITRSSSSSRHESRNCRQRHAGRSPST
jgi:hypothetical protein